MTLTYLRPAEPPKSQRPLRALMGAGSGVLIAAGAVGSLYLMHALGQVIETYVGWIPTTMITMAGTALVGFIAVWRDQR